MLSEPAVTSMPSQLPAQGRTLLAAVQALSLELDTVRHEVDAKVSARLAGAEDELAAIHDEMARQQEEIESLLTGADSSRSALTRRFLAALPLATVLTSSSGMILEGNPAAHTLLRVPPSGLLAKPIFAFIAQGDRRRLRSALSRTTIAADDDLLQVPATVTPRHGVGVPARIALARDLGAPFLAGNGSGIGNRVDGAASVFWVMLPDVDAAGRPLSHSQLEALTRLCRLGADGSDLRRTLGQVIRLCLQAITEASDASLLVGNPLEPTLAVTSSAAAQHLDGLQHVRAEGPVFDAFRSRRPIALDDAAVTEHRGLSGDPQAAKVRSLLAVPLLADEAPAGVLTLYAGGPGSVATLEALRQVMPFVEAAQTLIRDTRAYEEVLRTQQQLEVALTSRAVIDQAKGMIMVTLKCGADEAFAQLVRMSSTRHEKVRDVAQSMVDDLVTKRSESSASPSE